MNERVKELRKVLNLTMEKFGVRLGVKKNSISQIESGINNLTEQMLKAICREFRVNEDWMRTGEGNMFIETQGDFLKEMQLQYNLDDLDLSILGTYLNLPENAKKIVKEYLLVMANNYKKENDDSKE